MGNKVSPISMRLGYNIDNNSHWFAQKKDFSKLIAGDILVRSLIKDNLPKAAVLSKISIERSGAELKLSLHTAKPGIIIGRGGAEIDKLRGILQQELGLNSVRIDTVEVRKPDLDATLLADKLARQLEGREAFRRAMKRTVSNALRSGALGIKVCVAGRLGGAEIARTEWYREGRVPLHTFKALIDYGVARAKTTYGIIGVKIWVFRGEATEVGGNVTA